MGTSGTGFFDNDDSGDWFDSPKRDIAKAITAFIDDPEGHYQDGIAALNVLVSLANQDMPIPIPMWNFYDFHEDMDSIIVTLQDHINQINDMGWREADMEVEYERNCNNLMRELSRLKVQLDDFHEERARRRVEQGIPPKRRRKRVKYPTATICRHCGVQVKDDDGVWVDSTGGDGCGEGVHEPKLV